MLPDANDVEVVTWHRRVVAKWDHGACDKRVMFEGDVGSPVPTLVSRSDGRERGSLGCLRDDTTTLNRHLAKTKDDDVFIDQ